MTALILGMRLATTVLLSALIFLAMDSVLRANVVDAIVAGFAAGVIWHVWKYCWSLPTR